MPSVQHPPKNNRQLLEWDYSRTSRWWINPIKQEGHTISKQKGGVVTVVVWGVPWTLCSMKKTLPVTCAMFMEHPGKNIIKNTGGELKPHPNFWSPEGDSLWYNGITLKKLPQTIPFCPSFLDGFKYQEQQAKLGSFSEAIFPHCLGHELSSKRSGVPNIYLHDLLNVAIFHRNHVGK